MNEYLNKLNDKQREAATHTEGPLLILAGAGSGKTSTITHRMAYLIREKNISPYNILAVTFTNKAAKEMRDRVDSLVGKTENMWISTFHSACLRMLRFDAPTIGYTSQFVVYDPTDQKTVIKGILKEFNIDSKEFNPAYFLSAISKAKEQMLMPEKYLKKNGEDLKTKQIYEVYKEYTNILKKNNAMDFDDLLVNAVLLLEKDEKILNKYQKRFKYIMVDEYQDTNQIQYKFIKLLAEGSNNLCVVGDDDQCIYQWRGADIRNILEFERDFKDVKVIKLEQNYRSTETILEAAHSVIKNNRGRKSKKLWTDHEKGKEITYFKGNDERDEAYFIAGEINRIKTTGVNYNDFAILYRKNAQSRTFEEALARREIPYRVLGGLRYYDRKEIKDIMCYMRLVQNKADNLALTRIINEPKRGIGSKTIEKLQGLSNARGESLFNIISDEDIVNSMGTTVQVRIRAFTEVIEAISSEQENLKISDIYDALLVKSGYLKALEDQNTVESEGRIENLMEFKSVIYDYEKEDPNMLLSEFMEKIALLAEVDNHNEDENAVVLMTMHSAKGLEFPYVFLVGLEDGLFPGWRAFDNEDSLNEERRLCYVGITRAKERLWLTGAEQRTIYGKTDYTRESQFLREIDKKLLVGDAIYEKKQKDNAALFQDGIKNDKAFKPFDQLKYAKQQMKQNVSNIAIKFEEGEKVTHSKFGEGTVLKTDGKIVTVQFVEGVKKLAIGIANIKKNN